MKAPPPLWVLIEKDGSIAFSTYTGIVFYYFDRKEAEAACSMERRVVRYEAAAVLEPVRSFVEMKP